MQKSYSCMHSNKLANLHSITCASFGLIHCGLFHKYFHGLAVTQIDLIVIPDVQIAQFRKIKIREGKVQVLYVPICSVLESRMIKFLIQSTYLFDQN